MEYEDLQTLLESVDELDFSLSDNSDDINISVSDDVLITDKNYFHNQTTSSDTWVIVHNLNKYPAVSIIDSAGDEVVGEITYNNLNQVTIKFAGAFKGSATLN